MSILDLQYNFAGLSLKDLLEARDAYHHHLLSKANVVGTAVGYYLIRQDEDWPVRQGQGKTPSHQKTYARTLFNSEVRDYSWPCVLAFVRTWAAETQFGPEGEFDASLIIPRTLYMTDGRAVPVCVVEVGEDQLVRVESEVQGPRPSYPLGGGCPIVVEVQGERHTATVGCLVTDGHATYALTARHASGEAAEVIHSITRNGLKPIGVSSPKYLTRLPFQEVYPAYAGLHSYVALDVGLVRVDQVADWTSNTYGLPPPGPLADMNEANLSLRLIDQPVIGYGAASGLLRGRLKALFYRHRSVGGYDYVGDFLIAPDGVSQTQPGDSGMVWHLDVTSDARGECHTPLSQRHLRPFAVEWGGQVLGDETRRATFAVATSLSNVCQLLDVELVTDLNRRVSGYWGRTGHYSIAAFAIELTSDPALRQLMQANANILSFDLTRIAVRGFDKSVGQTGASDEFLPLADVPDEIWKKLPKNWGGRTGGRDTSGGPSRSNGPEHPTHYADIDADYPPHKQNLRELCRAEPDKYLTVPAWLTYYDELHRHAQVSNDPAGAAQYGNKLKQGLLPFRLWQFFDAMVDFVKAGDVLRFVAAAGIAAHYMGDASQPLHGSVLADGDKSREGSSLDPKTGRPLPYGSGVHSAFETNMISRHAPDLLERIRTELSTPMPSLTICASGAQMARATIELMHDVATTLPPENILEAFVEAGGTNRVAVLDAMYASLATPTAQVMARGARYLALLWESAWLAGAGASIPAEQLIGQDPMALRSVYVDANFIPSHTLDEMIDVLRPPVSMLKMSDRS